MKAAVDEENWSIMIMMIIVATILMVVMMVMRMITIALMSIQCNMITLLELLSNHFNHRPGDDDSYTDIKGCSQERCPCNYWNLHSTAFPLKTGESIWNLPQHNVIVCNKLHQHRCISHGSHSDKKFGKDLHWTSPKAKWYNTIVTQCGAIFDHQ